MGKNDDDELIGSGAIRDLADGTELIVRPKAQLRSLDDAIQGGIALAEAKPTLNPVMTGYVELDAKMYRYAPKQVTILAADAGVGKSTFATQAALHAGNCGHGAGYLNLEMPEEMFGLRTAANFASLSVSKAAAGQLDDEQKDSLRAQGKLLRPAAKNVLIANRREHRTAAAVREFCADAKQQLAAQGKTLRLVIIDHILKILVNVRDSDTDGQGKARSELLTQIADEFDVHVLGLIHITRDASKLGKMPTKNDIAGSAWFDRDADNILIFHQKRNPDGTFVKGPNYKPEKGILSAQKVRWGSPFAIEIEYKAGHFFAWDINRKPAQLPEPPKEYFDRFSDPEAP